MGNRLVCMQSGQCIAAPAIRSKQEIALTLYYVVLSGYVAHILQESNAASIFFLLISTLHFSFLPFYPLSVSFLFLKSGDIGVELSLAHSKKMF